MDLSSSDDEIAKWFTQDEGKDIELGEQLTETQKLQGMRLLYTWRDQFCNDASGKKKLRSERSDARDALDISDATCLTRTTLAMAPCVGTQRPRHTLLDE